MTSFGFADSCLGFGGVERARRKAESRFCRDSVGVVLVETFFLGHTNLRVSVKGHTKRIPPTNQCIFCGSSDLSEEHVWPKWMRKHMPLSGDKHFRATSTETKTDGSIDFSETTRHLRPIGARKLTVACRGECNNGWMSRLEQEVKPFLVPLLTASPVALDFNAQRVLARWIVKTTMVWEFATPNAVVSTQDERNHLMTHESPEDNWYVWISGYVGSHFRQQHIRIALQLSDEPSDSKSPYDAQTFSIWANRLFVYAISSNVSSDYLHGAQMEVDPRVCFRIWPPDNSLINWPPRFAVVDHNSVWMATGAANPSGEG